MCKFPKYKFMFLQLVCNWQILKIVRIQATDLSFMYGTILIMLCTSKTPSKLLAAGHHNLITPAYCHPVVPADHHQRAPSSPMSDPSTMSSRSFSTQPSKIPSSSQMNSPSDSAKPPDFWWKNIFQWKWQRPKCQEKVLGQVTLVSFLTDILE